MPDCNMVEAVNVVNQLLDDQSDILVSVCYESGETASLSRK